MPNSGLEAKILKRAFDLLTCVNNKSFYLLTCVNNKLVTDAGLVSSINGIQIGVLFHVFHFI